MTKDWNRFKAQIEALYIRERKSLKEVRQQMHREHDFFASTRAYRIKLEIWGVRKNRKAGLEAKDISHSPSREAVEIWRASPVAESPRSFVPNSDYILGLADHEFDELRNVAFFCSQAVQKDSSTEPQRSGVPLPRLSSSGSLRDHGGTSFIETNLLPHPSSTADEWANLELHDLNDAHDFENTAANSLLDLSRDQPPEASVHLNSSKQGEFVDSLLGAITARLFSHLRELLELPEAAAISHEDLNTLLRLVVVEDTKEPHEASCDVSRLLLQHGASPHSPGSFGMTSLHIAVQRVPSLHLLDLLLESIKASNTGLGGVDPVDSDGNTPLLSLLHNLSLSSRGQNTIDFKPHFQLLLKAGANPNQKSKSGWTPFCLALELQKRTPTMDVVDIAFFIESGANVLDTMFRERSPFKFFLNTVNWLSTPGMEMNWVRATLAFLDRGANPSTVIENDPLLSFCLQNLLLFPKRDPPTTSAILSAARLLCSLVNPNDMLLQIYVRLLIRNLLVTTEDLQNNIIDCIETLVEHWAVEASGDESSTVFNLVLSSLNSALIGASKILRIVEIFLKVGVNPLQPDESLDRPIYVALRHFEGDTRLKVTELLLERSLLGQIDIIDKIHSLDSSWFYQWARACESLSWVLTHEKIALPQDLNRQQKATLVKAARSILADLCIKDAIKTCFQPLFSKSDKDFARQRISDIINSHQYQELGRVPVSHVQNLFRLVGLEEDALQTLQRIQRAAMDECLMLRYKNSLLERILAEKGIDVQAEIQARERLHSETDESHREATRDIANPSGSDSRDIEATIKLPSEGATTSEQTVHGGTFDDAGISDAELLDATQPFPRIRSPPLLSKSTRTHRAPDVQTAEREPKAAETHDDSWRLAPPLMDPNSFAFTSFANQPSGYYRPSPGSLNAAYHNQAGDLHTPTIPDESWSSSVAADLSMARYIRKIYRAVPI